MVAWLYLHLEKVCFWALKYLVFLIILTLDKDWGKLAYKPLFLLILWNEKKKKRKKIFSLVAFIKILWTDRGYETQKFTGRILID